jgi:hypothetical protein
MRVIVVVGGTAVEGYVRDGLLGCASPQNDQAQDMASQSVGHLFSAAYIAENRRARQPEVTTGVRKAIADTIDTDVAKLLYYDRKEDEELPQGVIEGCLRDGTVTMADMVGWFTRALTAGVEP